MKDFKGTNGKWYSEFSNLPQFSPNGHSTIKAGEIGTPVAIVPMPIGGVNTKERNIANASLIAAAPDLLEALLNIENDNGYIPEHIWNMRNKAIKKALK